MPKQRDLALQIYLAEAILGDASAYFDMLIASSHLLRGLLSIFCNMAKRFGPLEMHAFRHKIFEPDSALVDID